MDYPAWSSIIDSDASRKALLKGVLSKNPPSRIPKNRRPNIEGCDLGNVTATPSRIAGRELFIVYENASGRETERAITLRTMKGDAIDGSVYAFCHMRKALRQFRIDRIVECFEGETGEQVDPFELFSELCRVPFNVERADLEDFVRILVFMGYCDGDLALQEVGAIDDAISRFVLRCDGSDTDFEQATVFARRAAIEGIDFLMALRRMARRPDPARLARITLDSVQSIIDADWIVHHEEERWSGEVVKTLRRLSML